MPVQIDLRVEDDHWTDLADLSGLCERAITAAALRTMPDKSATIDVLLADNRALAALNKQWRDKDGPTDVLSFPAEPNPENFLGDIAIGFGVALKDARASAVSMEAHLSHLLIHGFLHLLGHDHVDDDEAERMEAIERETLANLGFSDPYSRIA